MLPIIKRSRPLLRTLAGPAMGALCALMLVCAVKPALAQAMAPNGLRGDYYAWDKNTLADGSTPFMDGNNNTDNSSGSFVKPEFTRIDGPINFNWDYPNSPWPGLLEGQYYNVRWTGQIVATTAGAYTFGINVDDGGRLWINASKAPDPSNDTPDIDEWKDQGENAYDTMTPLTLTAGQKVFVDFDYYQNGTGARARLFWTPPGGSRTIIPAANLIPNLTGLDLTKVPAAVTDLAVSSVTSSVATLTFTSPGDSGTTGTPLLYDIRYSTQPITDANFSSAATIMANVPKTVAGGTKVSIAVALNALENYYFAMKTLGHQGTTSALSNVPTIQTSAPAGTGDGLVGGYYAWDTNSGGTGFTGTFSDGNTNADNTTSSFVKAEFTRIDGPINFNWDCPNSPFPGMLGCDHYNIRWTGQIIPEQTGAYTFGINVDDGGRLWINTTKAPDPSVDTPTADGWKDQGETAYDSDPTMPFMLTAGKPVFVDFDYYQNGSGARARLFWTPPGQPRQIIPQADLVSGKAKGPVLYQRVEGLVTFKNAPAVGVTVTLGTNTATTDANGFYSMLIPAQAGTLSATEGAPYNSTVTAMIVAAAGKVTRQDFTVPVPPPPALRGLGIFNGDFRMGLTGWTTGGTDGGFAALETPGVAFSGVAGSDMIPFPNGTGADSMVVNVRSSGPAPLDSTGILVSDPFIPNAPTLKFLTLSESASVTPMLLLLTPTADPIAPAASDILLQVPILNDTPATGSSAVFEPQTVDISKFYNMADPTKGTPMRLEVTQHTAANGAGYFTLVSNFDAGTVVAAAVPAVVCGDLLGKGKLSVGDATLALRIAINLATASATNTAGACGHTINVGFATLILRAVVFGGTIAAK